MGTLERNGAGLGKAHSGRAGFCPLGTAQSEVLT